ncbi:MAG TPA: hypothetical protein PLW50_00810 [Smithellaceae bacterium]|jgi:hypothetical protein|nr:hypothetical protein [Smithellaceae bacterium]
MAERGFTPVSVHPLFTNAPLSAGDSATSRAIDLRYVAQRGKFAIATSVVGGTSTTGGTTSLIYKVGVSLDGEFISPSGTAATASTIGTYGTGGRTYAEFNPILTPFIKFVAQQSGAGTAGAQSKLSAELIVQ